MFDCRLIRVIVMAVAAVQDPLKSSNVLLVDAVLVKFRWPWLI